MALENLDQALNEMATAALIPVPPEPAPVNPWVPSVAAIKIIVGLMRQGVEAGWTRQRIREALIKRAREDYKKTLTRPMIDEIWDAWQAEIAERQAPAPEVTEP